MENQTTVGFDSISKLKIDKEELAVDNGYCVLTDMRSKDELTVTITLYEYRKLIKADTLAEKEINRLRREKYDIIDRKEVLEKENAELTKQLADTHQALVALQVKMQSGATAQPV